MPSKSSISVETNIKVPVEKLWKLWTNPEDITQWNHASDDWHTTTAENHLNVGGKFLYRMEAKDGSMGFDFDGTYDKIVPNKLIEYTMSDGRKVKVFFSATNEETKVIETFETENNHSAEIQRAGWQSILDNFKKYTESKQ